MFDVVPKVLAHKSVVDNGNFVIPDFILNKNGDGVSLFHRFCPHRMYPLHNPGEHVQNVYCKFHDYEWTASGTPINNDKKLKCGEAVVGQSGLVMRNFAEPEHQWVMDLTNETDLVYESSHTGSSNGSWLWLMDAQADLAHVHAKGIHPVLSQQINIQDVVLEEGEGWCLQTHPDGWWLYIFPFTFIEYGRPGCLMVNTITPNDIDSEFGFQWITQFYYSPSVSKNARILFETAEHVFREDVGAAEVQKGKYFPLMKAANRYESHCVHFGRWVTKHKR